MIIPVTPSYYLEFFLLKFVYFLQKVRRKLHISTFDLIEMLFV